MPQKPVWMTSIGGTRLDLGMEAERLEVLTVWQMPASHPLCQQRTLGFGPPMIENSPGG